MPTTLTNERTGLLLKLVNVGLTQSEINRGIELGVLKWTTTASRK